MAFSPKLLQQGASGAGAANYIEDVFSTYLYTGTGAAQTITNGINLSGKGGLVWLKNRSGANDHGLFDTIRGAGYRIVSNLTDAENFSLNYISSFGSTGFSLGAPSSSTNASGNNYASWTFRKQPKFFDVVTYTGTGTTNIVAHSLASVPGAIFIKRTSSAADWRCLCKNGTNYSPLQLNTIDSDGGTPIAINLCATSTTLNIGYIGAATGGVSSVNTNGETYVAYIFAHNAGGFGLSGSENVITCGSSSVNSSGNDIVDLGFEPQWVLIKPVGSSGGDWQIRDIMRNFNRNQASGASLFPNLASAETTSQNFWMEDSTGGSNGFRLASIGFTSQTYIYIAIRRGPMKVPTSGTSVFNLQNSTEPVSTPIFSAGTAPPDVILNFPRYNGVAGPFWLDRLRGNARSLTSATTAAETSPTAVIPPWFFNTGQKATIAAGDYYNNSAGSPLVQYSFIRAPSFFDEVCYTGTGSDTTQTHNLGVAPELVIIKSRSNAIVWVVGNTAIGFSNYLLLNATDASASGSNVFNSTAPTSTVFSIGAGSGTNQSGATYVAYLFATLAGVSKVGSYTGTATTKQIDCGFTGGARFVLIKRTDSTGDWYVWDSARGIVAGNDPYLLLNSTAAEVTNTDYVDTYSAGFEISSTAPAAINANGGTYIFLAIA